MKPAPESTARLARRVGTDARLAAILDKIAARHDVWVVGGAVDAWLRGCHTADIDVITTAPSDDLARLGFVPIGGSHGTFAYRRSSARIEATPLVGSLHADLLDRDFTAWAIALPWPGGAPVDPAGGLSDRRLRLVRTPQPPKTTLTADPVRILRALRRIADGYVAAPEMVAAIGPAVEALAQEPPERIGAEWLKLLDSRAPLPALRLAAAWPELIEVLTGLSAQPLLFGTPRGHAHTIWIHSARLIQALPPGPLRLAAYFHDLTKPSGPGHARTAAELADERLRRWACPKELRRKAVRLIAAHSFHIPSLLRDRSTLRRWVAANEDQLEDLLAFRIADRQVAGRFDEPARQQLSLFMAAVARETRLPWPRSPHELDLDAAALFDEVPCPRHLRARLLERLWEWALAAPAARNRSETLRSRVDALICELQDDQPSARSAPTSVRGRLDQ